MIEIFAKIGLINGIIAVFLIFQIILKAKRHLSNWAFTLLALSIALWSFGYWQWLSSGDALTAMLWVRIFTVGSILIPVFFLFWIVSLFEVYRKYIFHLVGLGFLSATLIANTFYSDLIIRGLEAKAIFPYWPIPGSLYIYYVVFLYVGAISLSLYILGRTFRFTSDINLKSQIKYIFWGSLIGFGGGISNFFLWYDILIPPYLNFLPAVGLILFYYASSKHRLFDIKVIATEFFVYVLWIAMLTRLVFATSARDRIIDVIVLTLILIIGTQLVKSVSREIEQREQLQKLSDELALTNKKLKALDQARAEFITMASHQLRTPPSTIKWYLAAILSGDFGKINPDAREALEKTEFTNNSLISLIDDMLNVSRIERGKIEFVFEKVNIIELVKISIDQLMPLAQLKKLQLVYKAPDTKIPLIMADREKIRQVISNLIDNAIKYTKTGHILVTVDHKDDQVMVFVEDTGKGISEEEMGLLFKKFSRSGDAGNFSTGLGLGLYLAKIVVEQHKGRIWAESRGLGKGSRFIFSIPQSNGFKSPSALVDLTRQKGQ